MASLYDSVHHLRRINPEGWQRPEDEFLAPARMMTPKEWVQRCAVSQIHERVPKQVHDEFERARAAILYGWYHYSLATLGMDHSWRILELAVRLRSQEIGKESKNFASNIDQLVLAGIISGSDKASFHAARELRNSRSHLTSATLWEPGACIRHLELIAERINQIYDQTTDKLQHTQSD